jgi:hypothetical protein
MKFKIIYGVDFSGAKEAGRNIWIAAIRPRGKRYELVELHNLGRLCGTDERDAALAHLVNMIRSSRSALWGIDAPFGLPIEVMDSGMRWPGQLKLVGGWQDGAHALGIWCLNRAKILGGANHIRRVTDTQVLTPFDCYHYRIIYQTFHAMRDVLLPLSRSRGTAVPPFQYPKVMRAERVVVETCPSSTLKRLRLPHQNYKQPAGGPLTAKRRRTRGAILARLSRHVRISPIHRRQIMRNPGGDAIDAVLAALGAAQAWQTTDHAAVARHPRHPREGFIYA